jgi:hypothetical protein
MEPPPLSETKLYDILIEAEAQLSPKADRLWELIKIEPERWHAPVYGSGSMSFWAVGLFGKRVIWYNEIEHEFTTSPFGAYGQISEQHFGPTELNHTLEQLIRCVAGEQAYSS